MLNGLKDIFNLCMQFFSQAKDFHDKNRYLFKQLKEIPDDYFAPKTI